MGLRVSSLKEVKIPKTTLGDDDKSLRAWLPKEDNEPSVWGKNPHNYEVKIPKTTLGDEDKSLRAWLPKEDNELSVWGKNPHSCI